MFARQGKGTPIPFDPPKFFVAKGLYRFVRNPMYLAALAIILGEVLILGIPLLCIFFLISAVVLHFYVVYIEEPKLKDRFGQDYLDYLKKVPRWFPKIR
jgi:protein-S-isoprenylcysteine O-methyltransferase Ste14